MVLLNLLMMTIHMEPTKDIKPSMYMQKLEIKLPTLTSSIYLCCSMQKSYRISTNYSGLESASSK